MRIHTRSRVSLAAALLAAALAAVLYWPVGRLPLIYDTLLHIRIAGGLTLANVWLPTEAFGFYRPLTFVPLLLVERAFGHYPAALLNALNIGQHALNAALLTALVARLDGGRMRALAAGLLFAAFPFSYQAVAVYGHNVHPAIVNLLLLGLHSALTALDAPHARRWWLLTGALFALALLTHESAILFGPYLALMLLLRAPRLPWPIDRAVLRDYAPALLFAAVGGVYLLLYQLLPITRAPQAGGAADLPAKLLYLAQAAAYPVVQPLNAGWLGAGGAVGSALAVTLGATLLALWRGGWAQARWLIAGWGWWLPAAVVIGAPLPAGYLLNGPRLLYVGSVGLALLWATLLTAALAARRRWATGLALAALLLLLTANGRFVRGRLAAYAELTAAIPLLRATLPPDQGVLLVNLPQWIAPPRNSYPLGAEFVQQLGDYLFAEEWTRDNLRRDVHTRAVVLPELLRGTAYGYAVHAQHDWAAVADLWSAGGAAVLLTDYGDARPIAELTGHVTPADDRAPIATVGPYTLHAMSATHCGADVTLTTVWTLRAPAPPALSAFAQLLAADGTLLAQRDRPLLGLRADLLALPADRQIVDRRVLAADADADAVLFGLYDYISGARLPVAAVDRLTVIDDALRVPLTPACGA